jgi:hypothetical protein
MWRAWSEVWQVPPNRSKQTISMSGWCGRPCIALPALEKLLRSIGITWIEWCNVMCYIFREFPISWVHIAKIRTHPIYIWVGTNSMYHPKRHHSWLKSVANHYHLQATGNYHQEITIHFSTFWLIDKYFSIFQVQPEAQLSPNLKKSLPPTWRSGETLVALRRPEGGTYGLYWNPPSRLFRILLGKISNCRFLRAPRSHAKELDIIMTACAGPSWMSRSHSFMIPPWDSIWDPSWGFLNFFSMYNKYRLDKSQTLHPIQTSGTASKKHDRNLDVHIRLQPDEL